MPDTKTPGAVITPIPESFLTRVKTASRYVVSSVLPNDWFSPGQPLPPLAQEQAYGRGFDYPTGYNWKITPRADENVSFATLRTLADSYDLLRLLIETRKDQLEKMRWTIVPRDENPSAAAMKRAEALQSFLRFPDQEHTWEQWLRILLEELLVLDAPCVLPRFTRGGEPYSLEIIDGATIKRVIDQRGRTPIPPDPAYQQIIKGLPSVNYTRDELVYFPRNPRSNRVYGYGPVEQVIMTINISLRKQLGQLQFFSEGSTPDLLMSLPADWSPNQISDFKQWWDSVLSGNTGSRRGAMFVPEGAKPYDTKERQLKDDYDEWLARIICFAFSISPQPFTKQMNRATAESAQEAALEEGLAPLQHWVSNLLNLLIVKYFKSPELEFRWEEEESVDPQIQAQINDMYVRNGIYSVDEVRISLGEEPIGATNAIYTGTGPIVIPMSEEKIAAMQAAPEPVDASQNGDNASPDGETAPKNAETAPDGAKDDAKKLNKRARASTTPYQKQLEAALHAGLKNQASRAARFGAKKLKKNSVNKADGVDEEEFDAALPSSLRVSVTAAIQGARESGSSDGYLEALGEIDREQLAAFHNAAIQYASERAGELMADDGLLSSATREAIRTAVSDAIANGDSSSQLARSLADDYAFSADRAAVIARTEIATANVAGRLDGYRAAGVTHKEWLLSANPCAICEENAAAGAIPIDAEFPSGDDGAPSHPNCECDTVSVDASEPDAADSSE